MNATSMKAFLGGLALVLGASACATESTTVRTMSEPQAEQTPAASYPVPQTDPKGTAYVMSLGRESLASPSGAPAQYLHLRIAVENKADETPWILNAHDQMINLGGGSAQPTYAKGAGGTSVVTVASGQQGYLDLFYEIPQGPIPAQAALAWQVRRGSEVFAESTPFALQSAQTPDYAYYQPVGVRVEYWPAWWWGVGYYGPWWWGPGWGPYPYWGYYRGPHYHGGFGPGPGYFRSGPHGGGWHASPPPPSRGFGGGGGGWHASPPPPSRGFGGGGGGGRMRFPGARH